MILNIQVDALALPHPESGEPALVALTFTWPNGDTDRANIFVGNSLDINLTSAATAAEGTE